MPAHICSNCGETTNIQAWTKDVCPTDRGDEIREGWEWLCQDCYAVPQSERGDDIPYCEQDDYKPEVGIDICAHGVAFCEECEDCEEEEECDGEPDYNCTPYEESQSYRESMIDAGRGHLIK